MQKPCKVVNTFRLKSWYSFQIHGRDFHVSGSGLTLLFFRVSLFLIKSLRIHSKFLLIPAESCLRKEQWPSAAFFLPSDAPGSSEPALSVGDVDSRHSWGLCLVYLVLPLPLEDSLNTQYININLMTCLNSSLKLLGRVQQLSHLVRCKQ